MTVCTAESSPNAAKRVVQLLRPRVERADVLLVEGHNSILILVVISGALVLVLHDHVETPSPLNPLGVKGAGEAGVIPVPALFASAIDDALSPFGLRIREMPLHPCRLYELLQEAKRA